MESRRNGPQLSSRHDDDDDRDSDPACDPARSINRRSEDSDPSTDIF